MWPTSAASWATPTARVRRTPARSGPRAWLVEIRVLGGLEVVVEGGASANFGRSRVPPLLLKTLVALTSGGRAVPAERLIAALWPDSEGDDGRRAFDVTLSRLRRGLGARGHAVLRMEAGRLSLDRSLCWNDLAGL